MHIGFGQRATIGNAEQTRIGLLDGLSANDTVELDMGELGEVDVSLIQLIESARAYAGERSKALRLVERDLSEVAERMTNSGEQQAARVGGVLSRSLGAIRDSAAQTESSMNSATRIATSIVPMMQGVTAMLASCEDMSAEMDEVLEELEAEGPWNADADVAEPASHALREFMEQMARSYTMADERKVHDQYLPPGMPPLGSAPKQAVAQDDDLFDSFDGFEADAEAQPASSGEDDADLDDVFF